MSTFNTDEIDKLSITAVGTEMSDYITTNILPLTSADINNLLAIRDHIDDVKSSLTYGGQRHNNYEDAKTLVELKIFDMIRNP